MKELIIKITISLFLIVGLSSIFLCDSQEQQFLIKKTHLKTGNSTINKGDINQDGEVTLLDIRLILQKLVNDSYTNEEKEIIDYNNDDKASLLDLRLILQYILNPTGDPEITINDEEIELNIDSTKNINYTSENIDTSKLSWESSDEDVVTVDNTGKLTGVNYGTATITVNYLNKVSAEVNVRVFYPDLKKLRVSGTDSTRIVNSSNKTVVLRGFNLGAWLSKSTAFLPISDVYNENPNQRIHYINNVQIQYEISGNNHATDPANIHRQELMKTLDDNFITTDDLDILADMGVNAVRVPLDWTHFIKITGFNFTNKNTPEAFTYQTKSDSDFFHYLDWIVDECKKRGIYVIFDLHVANGGLNEGGYRTGYTTFWAANSIGKQNRKEAIELWKKIATHFKNDNAVAGYDIVNEPQVPDTYYSSTDTNKAQKKAKRIISFYDKAYAAIHSIDNNHMIFLEQTCVICGASNSLGSADNIGLLPDPKSTDNGEIANYYSTDNSTEKVKENVWTNVVYSTHDYFGDSGDSIADTPPTVTVVKQRIDEKLEKELAMINNYKVPLFIGEFNHYYNVNYQNCSECDGVYNGRYYYSDAWDYAIKKYEANRISYTAWTYKGSWEPHWALVYYGRKGLVASNRLDLKQDSYEKIKTVFGYKSDEGMKFNETYHRRLKALFTTYKETN